MIYIHIYMQNTYWRNECRRAKTSLKKYTSHFIWKVCMWEGVGDRTELQHIDPHSSALCLSCSPGLLNRRSGGPLCWVRAFSTASCHQRVSKLTDFLSSPSYMLVQSPTQYLWNGMFVRHQAEITVMQFTGHSLPVHQSMAVPWDFTLYAISSHNCRLNVSLPSGASLWNGMLGLGRRSIYNSNTLNHIHMAVNGLIGL